MVTTPADTPVTTPDEEPTVAIEGLLLLQTPPGVVLLTVIVPKTQTEQLVEPDDAQDMAAGALIMFTDMVL